MNILFVIPSLDMGGVEKVTCILANKLVEHAHNISILCVHEGHSELEKILNEKIKTYVGHGRKNFTLKDILFIRKIIKSNQVDVIVSQYGRSPLIITYLKLASLNLGVKIISAHHNDPCNNGKLMGIRRELESKKSLGNRIILLSKYVFIREVFRMFMKYTFLMSDKFMLLSEKYYKNFIKYLNIHNTDKIIIQTNPITIKENLIEPRIEEKENAMLFVGRLDEVQKRVSRILELWQSLNKDIPGWKLYLIGNGPNIGLYKKNVVDNKIENIFFEGFQTPDFYYKKGLFIILTSDFEGFPLVLPEAMNNGVIPIVLASFDAIYDIVEDGENGLLFNTPFDVDNWKQRILNAIKDRKMINDLSAKAYKTSLNYSIENVYIQWETTLNSL